MNDYTNSVARRGVTSKPKPICERDSILLYTNTHLFQFAMKIKSIWKRFEYAKAAPSATILFSHQTYFLFKMVIRRDYSIFNKNMCTQVFTIEAKHEVLKWVRGGGVLLWNQIGKNEHFKYSDTPSNHSKTFKCQLRNW